MKSLHYAVVVGINRYPEISHLKRAAGDAEAFATWLMDADGGNLPPANVARVFVADEQVPDATVREQAIPKRDEVFNKLYTFRKAAEAHTKQHPEDWEQTRLYFYVSGHGIAPAPKDAALLMANAGPDWYGENIACSQLIAFFGECQSFHEIVIFADCCRERAEHAPLGGVPWTRAPRDNGPVLTALGCATYFGDLAYEPEDEDEADPDVMRGYFTHALLEGLRGQVPDSLGTGEINTNNLASYVHQRVITLTSHRRYPQQPTMDADPGHPIIFRPGKPPEPGQGPTRPITHAVHLKIVTPFVGKVLLIDGNLKVIAEHMVPGGEWMVNLGNGLYQVIVADETTGIVFREKGSFKVMGEDRDVEL